ncbi:MAG: S4 domain-containing protein [Rikenellaceae bacterium]
MSSVRLDKYLWSIRLFKTRSDAADAARNNRVLINDAYAKPSREVKIGDHLSVRKGLVTYSYIVKELLSSRVGAKLVADYIIDTTPQSELDKLNQPRETIFVQRDRGTGRPTKRDRREIDELIESMQEIK